MKDVQYRGGIITFRVPDDWVEEASEEGAAYYANTPGSGTLRVNVTTMQPPEPVAPRHLLEAAAANSQAGDPEPEPLPNGNALRVFWRNGVEEGRATKIRYWFLAGGAPPTTVRIAVFSFTIPVGRDFSGDLALLDAELRQAKFTTLTSEEVQARVSQTRKPWWKPW